VPGLRLTGAGPVGSAAAVASSQPATGAGGAAVRPGRAHGAGWLS
jgi:hypothetical protein